jgi:hypothetical protein
VRRPPDECAHSHDGRGSATGSASGTATVTARDSRRDGGPPVPSAG